MSLIALIILLVVLGVLFFLVEQIPMAAPYQTLVRVVSIVVAILLILQAVGVNTGIHLRL